MKVRTAWLLGFVVIVGCRSSRGREGPVAPVDPAAYPPCDAPSDPYRPSGNVPPGAPSWIRRFGCQADDRATAVAFTPNGDVVATGSYGGIVSFGDAPLRAVGRGDAFVARWDEKGSSVWSVTLGGLNSHARGTNLEVNRGGDVLASGRFDGVLNVSRPQLLSHGLDPYVVKLNKDGAFVWGRRFERAGTSAEGKVPFATDAFGGLLLPVAPSGVGSGDGFISRVDASGDLPGRVGLSEGPVSGIAVDAASAVVLAGHGGVRPQAPAPAGRRFNVRLRPSASVGSLFVTKIDAHAQRVWTREIKGQDAKGFGEPLVAVDQSGAVYLASSFEGSVDVGTGLLRSGGGFDVFLLKLDPNGRTLWSRAFPGPQGNEWVTTLSVDGAGNVVVGGAFERAVDFGGGPIMSAGPASGFVTKLDPFGRHAWSRVFGAQGSSAIVESVALHEDGRVAIAGSFQGWTDFGAGLVPSAGAWDGFVAMLVN